MQAVSGKITGMWKAISTSRVSQFFNDLEHRARQSDVAVAILLIVFSVNLSGITGIVRKVIKNQNEGSFHKQSVAVFQRFGASCPSVGCGRCDLADCFFSEFIRNYWDCPKGD